MIGGVDTLMDDLNNSQGVLGVVLAEMVAKLSFHELLLHAEKTLHLTGAPPCKCNEQRPCKHKYQVSYHQCNITCYKHYPAFQLLRQASIALRGQQKS